MERLTPIAVKRRVWIPRVLSLGALAAGPQFIAIIITAISGVITLPITGQLSIASNRYEIFNVELLLIYIIAVMGVNILTLPGLLSIGHGAIFGLGAYVVAILMVDHHWSFWLALPAAGIICAALGVLIGIPSLRLGVYALVMVTLGYGLIFNDVVAQLRSITHGGDGILNIQMPAPFGQLTSYYWLLVIALVIVVMLATTFTRSPLGRRMVAVGQRPLAAESLGIAPYQSKLGAFSLSSLVVGLAGGLYAPLIGFVTPDSFTTELSILFLLMVLIGGAGSVIGPILGAVLLFRLPIEVERVTDSPGQISTLVYGVFLVISVYLFPRGIISLWWWIRRRWEARKRQASQERARADLSVVLTSSDRAESDVLVVNGLAKNLGGVQALSDVDLTVRAGSIHALIGPNGAGKTTMLNIMSGYLAADRGTITLFGRVAPKSAHARSRSGMARTFQTPQLFDDLSCIENVMVAADNHRRARWFSYLARLPSARREERTTFATARGILDAVGLSDKLWDPAQTLPPGEKRLLEVGRVVAMTPGLVLMDEPAAGLTGGEITELEEILHAFRKAGVAVLLVEHHMDLVMAVADEVSVIDFGRLIAHGSPEEIRVDPAVVAAYLGESDPSETGASA